MKEDGDHRDTDLVDNVYDNRSRSVNGDSSTANGLEPDPFDLGGLDPVLPAEFVWSVQNWESFGKTDVFFQVWNVCRKWHLRPKSWKVCGKWQLHQVVKCKVQEDCTLNTHVSAEEWSYQEGV